MFQGPGSRPLTPLCSAVWGSLSLQVLGLHSVHQEAELIAQCLVPVRHADLCHVGPLNIVPLWSILQVVHPQEMLLFLRRSRGCLSLGRSTHSTQFIECHPPS